MCFPTACSAAYSPFNSASIDDVTEQEDRQMQPHSELHSMCIHSPTLPYVVLTSMELTYVTI